MRVIARTIRARLRRFGPDDRGVTAVTVVISMGVIFGAAMLSVDAGALWVARRDLIGATDAASLAAAAAFVHGEDGCAAAAEQLEANVEGAVLDGCTSAIGGDAVDHVVTEGTSPKIDVLFGAVLGVEDQSVGSASAAQWGPLYEADNVRPIGICVNEGHVASWMGTGVDTGVHPAPGVHRVPFTKDIPDMCGASAPGNWGWLDFNGGSRSNNDLSDLLENGYDGSIGVNDCNADGDIGDMCEGDPGSSGGSLAGALQSLVDNGTEFLIVIYDSASGDGSNVRYRVVGFINVVLRGFRITGSEASRYFDFEFRRTVLQGRCCDPDGVAAGALGIRLCGADHDPKGVSGRCGN